MDPAKDLSEYHEPLDEVEKKVKQLAQWIRESQNMVAFTGAGVSTSAGIPDFRGPDGVWTKAAQGITIDRNFNFDVDPTLTHMSLVGLRQKGILKALVSTNTDGMHLRSGIKLNSFQEVHGNKNVEACAYCGRCYYRASSVKRFQVNDKTRITERRCDDCKNPLRWTNVAFGQSMPDLGLKNAFSLAENSDLSLVLGTSMQVEPAASLAQAGKRNRNFKLVLVNLQKTATDSKCNLRIFATCDQVISLLMKELNQEIPAYIPLDRSQNPLWQLEFNTYYKFRKPGIDWFEGPHDPSIAYDPEDPQSSKPDTRRYLKVPKGDFSLEFWRTVFLLLIKKK